jgi:hypothetical protein
MSAFFPIVLGHTEDGKGRLCQLFLNTEEKESTTFATDFTQEIQKACDLAKFKNRGVAVKGFDGRIFGDSVGLAAYVAASGKSREKTAYTGTVDSVYALPGQVGPIGGLLSKKKAVVDDLGWTLVAPVSHYHAEMGHKNIDLNQTVFWDPTNPVDIRGKLVLIDHLDDIPR